MFERNTAELKACTSTILLSAATLTNEQGGQSSTQAPSTLPCAMQVIRCFLQACPTLPEPEEDIEAEATDTASYIGEAGNLTGACRVHIDGPVQFQLAGKKEVRGFHVLCY